MPRAGLIPTADLMQATLRSNVSHWEPTMALPKRWIGVMGNNRGSAEVDAGTRVFVRKLVSQLMAETTSRVSRVTIEALTTPVITPTRMQLILELAPLSRRQWAEVFGVSHAAIQKWATGDEPAREELDTVLGLLQRASVEHGDLKTWLGEPVGRSSVTPLELLRASRWRAFMGAIHTRWAPKPDVSGEELLRLRKEQLPWAMPEPTPTSDES